MNDIELTQLFVDYAKLSNELDLTKDIIAKEVLDRGESVKIAGVTASYYKPTTGTPRYDEAIALFLVNHSDKRGEFEELFQHTTVTYQHKSACEYYKLTADPGEEKPARVVVKYGS